MSKNLTKCKTCSEEIARNAKICPRCGEKNPHGKASLISVILVLFAVLFVIGQISNLSHGGSSGAQVTSTADTITKEALWMDAGKDAVKEKLKDPDSAKFKDVFFHRGKDGVPITCGKVNSKNGFGGYSDFQGFVSAGSAELTFLQDEVSDFHNVWKRLCVN